MPANSGKMSWLKAISCFLGVDQVLAVRRILFRCLKSCQVRWLFKSDNLVVCAQTYGGKELLLSLTLIFYRVIPLKSIFRPFSIISQRPLCTSSDKQSWCSRVRHHYFCPKRKYKINERNIFGQSCTIRKEGGKKRKMFGTDKKMSAAMIKECDYQRKLAHVGT